MVLRPFWSGNIRLSLVSLPVRIYAALNHSRQIPLHEIYRAAGDEEAGPDEVGGLQIASSKTLDIVEFVNADAIDELYFEAPYFVVPDYARHGGRQEDAFAIIRDALRETGKAAIGQLAIGGRERLCSLKPCGSGILLETLRYEDEARESDPDFAGMAKARAADEELGLAKELIRRKSAKFDVSKFRDHYRTALTERPPATVVNLMDALRESLKAQKTPEERPRPRLSRRRKAG